MILADKGVIPPRNCNHDCNIVDYNEYTVEYYLNKSKLPIPNHWYTDIKKY